MTTLNRRSFLKKSSFLPFLATLATGFTPRGQAKAEDILYARRLPRDFSPNRTHIFYLNSRGRDRLDRYTVYEPPVSDAFYHLRDKVSANSREKRRVSWEKTTDGACPEKFFFR